MNDQKVSITSESNYDRPSVETEGEYAENNKRFTEVENNYLLNPIEGYNPNTNNLNQNQENLKINQINESEKLPPGKKVLNLKMILLGDCGVGKTSILNRYIHKTFSYSEKATISEDHKTKIIDLDQESIAQLNIWDTAGEERYSVLPKQYYKDSHCVIIVFDLTDEKSFSNIKNKINEVDDNAPRDVVIAIVGNKSDLTGDIKINKDEVDKIKEQYPYYEVSAKNGNNVSLLFEELCYKIIEKQKQEKNGGNKELRGSEERNSIRIDKKQHKNEKNGKKCKC